MFSFPLPRHQQAAAYHQAGALRAGSPYTLPISAAGSRFSPGGLLGGPGLPPTSGGPSGGHHLPHIKPDLDAGVPPGHHGSSGHHRAHHHEKECKLDMLIFKSVLMHFLLFYSQKERESYQEAPQRFHALHEGDASRGASRMYA